MGRGKAEELAAIEVQRLRDSGFHAVGGVSGLYMQIDAKGNRSWILRAVIGGKRRDMGLGAFPDVTLAGAREKAREARLDIDRGIDPIEKRKDAKAKLAAERTTGKTFQACAVAYIKAHADTWKNPKHYQQWENTLETYVFPVMGRLLAKDITQSHVLEVLEPIWKTKTETASRLRGRIESVLDWATVRGHRQGENPARWKGHLDKLLPMPSKIAKVKHMAALPVKDTGSFMAALRDRDGMASQALELLILTAARSGEVRGCRWSELDLENGVWTVPAERMKAGKEHRVPLSEQALRLLQRLPRFKGNDLVFPSPKGLQMSDMSMTAIMRRMDMSYTVHGFRSTFRDWAAEYTNHPRELAEQSLAHAIENKVEAAYRRGDVLEKRRRLMQDWADFCDVVSVKAGEVVPIRKGATA